MADPSSCTEPRTHTGPLRLVGRPLTHYPPHASKHAPPAQQTDEHPPPYGIVVHTALPSLTTGVCDAHVLCQCSPDLSPLRHGMRHGMRHT
jgi:hypothetical protein